MGQEAAGAGWLLVLPALLDSVLVLVLVLVLESELGRAAEEDSVGLSPVPEAAEEPEEEAPEDAESVE
ncbi:hypothetical protein [Brachybacterium alimentarium]|uniref:hypothetical protein n=1 Tax=Brachybacterium alimentarium TaxID=47845 RepID=UPI003FB772AE